MVHCSHGWTPSLPLRPTATARKPLPLPLIYAYPPPSCPALRSRAFCFCPGAPLLGPWCGVRHTRLPTVLHKSAAREQDAG
jgi:hypothetical protein